MSLGKTAKHALYGLGFHACAFSFIYLLTRTGEPGYLTTTGRWLLWLEGFPTTWVLCLVERDLVQALPLFQICTLTSLQWLAIGVLCRNFRLETAWSILRIVVESKIAKNALALLVGSAAGVAVHAVLFISILAIACPPIAVWADDKCYNWLLLESFPISYIVRLVEIHGRLNHVQKFAYHSVQWIVIGAYFGVCTYNIFIKRRGDA